MTPLLSALLALAILGDEPAPATTVRAPLTQAREVEVDVLIAKLAEAIDAKIDIRAGGLRLPVAGFDGALAPKLIEDSLGPGVTAVVQRDELLVTIGPEYRDPKNKARLARDLETFAAKAAAEAGRRARRYGMHARESYRPNDPQRRTICLVHGINASSGVFVHMITLLENEGFGIILYDYPFNQDLDKTVVDFARDWKAFRKRTGEKARWATLAHSMGSLVVRSYIENERAFAGDVSHAILLGPPNLGSPLARAQAVLQLMGKMKAIKGVRKDPFAELSDALGAAGEDLAPGSAFLEKLNAKPPAIGVRYHILAGDSAFLTKEARGRIDAQTELIGGQAILGRFVKLGMEGSKDVLDVLTDGMGDGCVAVSATKIKGVEPPVVIHANHVELIRAPLFFPDPGPVVSMPYVLEWLKAP